MSDLRLNYSETSFNTILGILEDLQRVQGDKKYEIIRWGKMIINYGVKQSDFDKLDSSSQRIFKTTERQFKSYKYDLWNLKLIEQYDKENNKIKGGTRWSITPLGYLFYLKYQNKFSIIPLFEFFNRTGSNSLKKFQKKMKARVEFTRKSFWSSFNDKQINNAMKILLDNLDFNYIENRLILTLYVFNPTSLNKIVLTQVIISNPYSKVTKPNKTSKEKITSKSDLDFGLSWYMSLLLPYYLIIYSKKSDLKKLPKGFPTIFSMIKKIIQEDAILDFTEIEKKSVQSYGQFDTKLINHITKYQLSKVIKNLS